MDDSLLGARIGDRRIIRLIQKWLKAGVLEAGAVSVSDKGTGQGSVISPLLANIYLHYALDLWAVRWRRREATGDMVIVRYADDFIVGFQHEIDARRFLDEMRERLRTFALSLHPENICSETNRKVSGMAAEVKSLHAARHSRALAGDRAVTPSAGTPNAAN